MSLGFTAWLQEWQTLVAATVAFSAASIASYVALHNTTRSLEHAERSEKHRRMRKHSAVRSVLPIALAEVLGYAERSVLALNGLVGQCDRETLPQMLAPADIVEPLPTDALETLAVFIEFSDTVDPVAIEGTAALIQIHDSRLRGLTRDNRDPAGRQPVDRAQLESSIIDAAAIYAAAGLVFDYAHRRIDHLPGLLTWDDVRVALDSMRIFEDEFPRLHDLVRRRESVSDGPFEAG
jgi:hypothetical protein